MMDRLLGRLIASCGRSFSQRFTRLRIELENLEDRLSPSTFQFSSAFYSVAAAPTNSAQITVTRTGDTTQGQSVHYATSDGSAMASAAAYSPASGTLTFGPGVLTQTFSVYVSYSQLIEYTRTVHLTLSQPTGGASLGAQSSAALTIVSSNPLVSPTQLSSNDFTSLPGSGESSLQYLPDGTLAQLLEMNSLPNNPYANANVVYVTRNDFGEFVPEELPFDFPPAFRITTTDPEAQLIIDSKGTPNVLAVDTNDQLEQLQRGPSGWTQVAVVSLAPADGNLAYVPVGFTAALGPDDSLNILLAFTNGGIAGNNSNSGPLVYGTNAGGSWTFQQVTTLGNQVPIFQFPDIPRFLSLAIDSQGVAHIAYTPGFVDNTPAGQTFGREFSALAYATNASGQWTTQVVYQPSGDTGDAGLGSSIAIGPGNSIAIASFYAPEAETGSTGACELLYNVLQPNGTWGTTIVATQADGYVAGDGGFTGYNPLLRFDSSGDANIVFSDYASQHFGSSGQQSYAGQIRHAVLVNGQWSLQTVFQQTNPLANELAFPTMALSPSGAIAYAGLQITVGTSSAVTNYVLLAANPLANFPQLLLGAASNLTHSPEYYSGLVTADYELYLHRKPDGAGLASWVSQLQAGLSDQQLAGILLGSAEFINDNGGLQSNGKPGAAWVNAVYEALLDRAADAGGTSSWLNQLANGATPTAVATAIASTSEAEALVIDYDFGQFLERAPDAAGLSALLQLSAQGTSNETIAADLIASHEYFFNHGQGIPSTWVAAVFEDVLHRPASTTEIIHLVGDLTLTPTQRFVAQVYFDLLHRQADYAGLSSWTNFLNNGSSPATFVADIEASTEYRQDMVAALFEQYLHRGPDAGGLANFTNALAAGATDQQVATALAASGEYYQNRGQGTIAGFITALYNDALGRAPDAGGLAQFEQAMANGASTGAVATAIIDCAEHAQDLVNGFFETYLHRPADPGSLNTFANKLLNGTTEEAVIAALLVSPEYFADL